MHPLRRLLRHWRTPLAVGPRNFTPATLRAIEATLQTGTTMHRAHLQIVIEVSLPASVILQRKSSRQRARRLFAAHQLWDTAERTGVLIYINLADRRIEIVADHGVSNALTSAQWTGICQDMTQGFADGLFHAGMLDGLQNLNCALQTQLPYNRADNAQAEV